MFSIFPQTVFGINFRHQIKNNVVETISCFVCQLSKKYCVYSVSEHLTYCTQINEYWFNKNACLNIVEWISIAESEWKTMNNFSSYLIRCNYGAILQLRLLMYDARSIETTLKSVLVKRPRNLRSFLNYKKQWEQLSNRNVI